MASNVRFVDSLKVGAYQVENSGGGGGGSGVTINKGIKVTNSGTLQLFEFTSLPTAIEGGIVYNNNEFYVGLG